MLRGSVLSKRERCSAVVQPLLAASQSKPWYASCIAMVWLVYIHFILILHLPFFFSPPSFPYSRI